MKQQCVAGFRERDLAQLVDDDAIQGRQLPDDLPGIAVGLWRPATTGLRDSAQSGARAAIASSGGATTGGAGPASAAHSSAPPTWAARMGRSQSLHHGTTAASHALRSGEGMGSGASVSLSERDP